MPAAQLSTTQQIIARRIAISRRTEARKLRPTSDIVRMHLLGGFDPSWPGPIPENTFVDVERSSVSKQGSVVTFGDRKVDLDDFDKQWQCLDLVERAPLAGTALDEARTFFDRNVQRLEETSRMFHVEGIAVGQDPENPKFKSTAPNSVTNTVEGVVLRTNRGDQRLFAWDQVAKVTGFDGCAEAGLMDYTPLRIFLLDGSVVEMHGEVEFECFS